MGRFTLTDVIVWLIIGAIIGWLNSDKIDRILVIRLDDGRNKEVEQAQKKIMKHTA